ncbi:MAG TPA: bifunctional biotin--[acetyl-CoA-carboxylase] synthetase/biotin operon repressor, partial [Candidatus Omnitrophota bacterium]|nr:bifunctional biotin--[acetyl-CoA-carboxylase] synthetase/biotin operon repressor [Candidatus Omnitrophota bacterium]
RLLRTILCMLERDYGIFVSGGFAALREKCKKYSIVLGKNVKIASPKGEINGTVLDIDENGRLVLDDSGTERRIFSGDIEMCR